MVPFVPGPVVVRCAIVVGLLWISADLHAAKEPFDGAGMLPYCVHDGQTLILLGYDKDKKAWTDFGGGPEQVTTAVNDRKRWETTRETAIREGSEESRHVISRRQITGGIQPGRSFDHPKRQYRCYTVRIDFIPIREFENTPVPVGSRWDPVREKTKFRWITLNELHAAIVTADDRDEVRLPTIPGRENRLSTKLFDSLSGVFQRGSGAMLFPR